MELPLLVTRGLVAMPSVMLPLDVARPASIEAVRAAQQGQRQLILSLETEDGCAPIGTVAQLIQVTALPAGRLRVMVRTLAAVRILSVDGTFAQIQSIPAGPEASIEARQALAGAMTEWVNAHPALDDAAARLFADPAVPSILLGGLAAQIGPFSVDAIQSWLALPVAERIDAMVAAMAELATVPVHSPVPAPAPEDDLGPMPIELQSGLRWTARIHARTALLDRAEMVAVTRDAWRGDWLAEHGHLGGLDDAVEAVVAEAVAEQEARRASWQGATDCERLEAALDELEASGLVTGLFGVDLADALGYVQDQGGADVSYVVFHQQDLLDAVNGQGLDLAFGGPDALAIGERAVASTWCGRAAPTFGCACRCGGSAGLGACGTPPDRLRARHERFGGSGDGLHVGLADDGACSDGPRGARGAARGAGGLGASHARPPLRLRVDGP